MFLCVVVVVKRLQSHFCSGESRLIIECFVSFLFLVYLLICCFLGFEKRVRVFPFGLAAKNSTCDLVTEVMRFSSRNLCFLLIMIFCLCSYVCNRSCAIILAHVLFCTLSLIVMVRLAAGLSLIVMLRLAARRYSVASYQ